MNGISGTHTSRKRVFRTIDGARVTFNRDSWKMLAASAAVAPILCVAPLVIAAWGGWLKWRLGGTTGDCLGAGVEITEVVLLYALTLASSTVASLL